MDRPSSVMSFLSDIDSDSEAESSVRAVPLFQLVPLRRRGRESRIFEDQDTGSEKIKPIVQKEVTKTPPLKKAASCLVSVGGRDGDRNSRDRNKDRDSNKSDDEAVGRSRLCRPQLTGIPTATAAVAAAIGEEQHKRRPKGGNHTQAVLIFGVDGNESSEVDDDNRSVDRASTGASASPCATDRSHERYRRREGRGGDRQNAIDALSLPALESSAHTRAEVVPGRERGLQIKEIRGEG